MGRPGGNIFKRAATVIANPIGISVSVVGGGLVLLEFQGWTSGTIGKLVTCGDLCGVPTNLGWLSSLVSALFFFLLITGIRAFLSLPRQVTDTLVKDREFKDQVVSYIRRRETDLTYREYTLTSVCARDRLDSVSFESVVESKSLFVILASFGTTQAQGEQSDTRSLSGIQFRTETDPNCSIEPHRLRADSATTINVALFLEPPIKTEVDQPAKRRRVAYQYDWPGLWDPLRNDDADSGEQEVSVDASNVKIVLVFPPKKHFGTITLEPISPGSGKITSELKAATQTITWAVGAVQKGTMLRYALKRNRKMTT